jgi:hypothetical protein
MHACEISARVTLITLGDTDPERPEPTTTEADRNRTPPYDRVYMFIIQRYIHDPFTDDDIYLAPDVRLDVAEGLVTTPSNSGTPNFFKGFSTFIVNKWDSLSKLLEEHEKAEKRVITSVGGWRVGIA